MDFYYKKSRLQQLKGFCYTVGEGSTVKAAEKLGLTPAAISIQIKSLERDLNIKLFYKKGRKLELTEEGKIFYDTAIERLHAIEVLFEDFNKNIKKIKVPQINIAAHHVALSHILPKYIKRYREIYPNIKIILHNISRNKAIEKLKNKEIDFIFYPMEEVPIQFYFKTIFSYDPILIVHKDNPLAKKEAKNITFKDCSKYNFIHLGHRITVPLFREATKTYNIGGDITLINGNWEILKSLVKKNIGISGVGSMYITENDKNITTKKITHLLPKMNYGITIVKNIKLTSECIEFIKIINSTFFNNDSFIYK